MLTSMSFLDKILPLKKNSESQKVSTKMNKNETSNKTFELEEMHPLNECGNSEVSNRRSNFPHPLFEGTSSISNDFETICAPGHSNSINTPVLTLPKFWETSPTTWFTVAESVFSLKRIVSEHIKFHAVVNALEARHIEKIKHVLVTANWAKPYSILKQALTKSFEASYGAFKGLWEMMMEVEVDD